MENKYKYFQNQDILSRFLLKLSDKYFVIGFYVLLFNLVTDLSLAFGFNAFKGGNSIIGLSENPLAWVVDGIAEPVIFATLAWTHEVGAIIFNSLIEENIFEFNESAKAILSDSRSWMHEKWVDILSAILSILIAGIIGYQLWISAANPGDWVTVHPMIIIVRYSIFALFIYALFQILFNIVTLVTALNKIFATQEIKIEPRHPDKAGGLGQIGKFASYLGYPIAIVGLVLTNNLVWSQQYGGNWWETFNKMTLMGVALYLILAPLLFFLPIRSAHKAMENNRKNLLKGISSEFNHLYLKIYNHRNQDADQLEPLQKKIKQLEGTYQLTEGFNTWPFDIAALRNFIGLVLAPFVPAVIEWLISAVNFLINLVKQ